MARASTPTLLSLDRYAKIMGLNPVHFGQGLGENYWSDPGACNDIWPQYNWQGPTVMSREELAQALADAETDIQRVLGFPVAPTFFSGDTQAWPKYYDRTLRNVNLRGKQLKTRWGRVIQGGRRGLTPIALNTVVQTFDEDGDGFDETVKLTVATTETDPRKIKVYFAAKNAKPEWEIRPLDEVTILGGFVTLRFKTWLIFSPNLWEAAPTREGLIKIDVEDANSYEAMVDVYREYVDTSVPMAQFTFPSTCVACGGNGCPECALATVDGCFSVYDPNAGLVVPVPATYSNGTYVPLSTCLDEPISVKLWYLAGDVSDDYVAGESVDPLSDYWAQAIAWLATARFRLPVCACGEVAQVFEYYQHDVAQVDRSRSVFFSVLNPEMLTNPFGTRVGEIRAWDRVSRVVSEGLMSGGAL